jgi:hypothetical protein
VPAPAVGVEAGSCVKLTAVSGSSPADLAVAFRSLSRRLREAIGDGPESAVTGLAGELRSHVDASARLLGTQPDADAVANAIMIRPADDWDQATLDELRRHALAAGAVLRRIAAVTESDRDDD